LTNWSPDAEIREEEENVREMMFTDMSNECFNKVRV
jgi:hypothetical protein